ncbi:MAG: M56 family metallopeptidase [bacterium]
MGGESIQPWSEGAALGVLLAKISLLLLLGWAAHYGLRQSHPRWRVLLWRGVIGGIVLIPLIFLAGPRWEMKVPRTLPVLIMPPAFEPEPAALEPEMYPPIDSPSPSTTEPSPSLVSSPSPPSVSIPQSNWNPASWIKQNAWLALLAGWGLGVAFFAAWLGRASVWVSRIIKTSQPATETVKRMVARVAEDLGARRDVTLRFSPHVPSPFLCGVLRPVIVLPARMRDLDYRDRLPGILAHEVAHLRSHDLPWYATIHGLRVILWFHPLTWRIWSAHAAACEEVSDSVAAAYVGNQETYSKTLACVALEIIARPAGAGGIPMTRTSEIRKRLESLQERWSGRPVSRRRVGAVSCAALLALAALAGMEPVIQSRAVAGDTISQDSQVFTMRQVVIDDLEADAYRTVSISPDGKYVLYKDKVWKFSELATGKVIIPGLEILDKAWGTWFHTLPISHDNKKITYVRSNQDDRHECLYVYEIDNKQEKLIWSGKYLYGLFVHDWTKDGKYILAYAEDYMDEEHEKKYEHFHDLYWISNDGTDVRLIKKYDCNEAMPINVMISPDGNWIAEELNYWGDGDLKGNWRDLRLLSSDGKTETVIVPAEKNVQYKLVGWLANDPCILYTSNRAGTWDLWGARIINGKLDPIPQLIKREIGDISTKGISHENQLFYYENNDQSDFYVADFDITTGEIQHPNRIKDISSWSNDGTQLISEWLPLQWKDEYAGQYNFEGETIPVYSFSDIHEVGPKIHYNTNGQTIRFVNIFPDHQSMLVWVINGNPGSYYRMDFHTKKFEPLLVANQKERASSLSNDLFTYSNGLISSDGETLYYERTHFATTLTADGGNSTRTFGSFWSKNLITGETLELYHPPEDCYIRTFYISLDGKWIALQVSHPNNKVKLLSLIGDETKDVFQDEDKVASIFGWAPDSQSILFASRDTPNTLMKKNIYTGQVEELCQLRLGQMSISPNNKRIAFTTTQHSQGLWVLENFLPREVARAGTQ